MRITIIIGILLSNLALKADPRYVTMAVSGTTNEVRQAVLTVAPHETAQLVSFPRGYPPAGIYIEKDGVTIGVQNSSLDEGGLPDDPVIVAGPARIILRVPGSESIIKAMCTWRLTPDVYPADKAVILYPGPAIKTAVTLECSSDLINWQTATNGVYADLPVAKFFRIRAEQVQ